ncbi:hypothetical protein AALO_G00216050 [Alosa alosa]|uniref:Uncharacterized protein n=1 Tax=Alosa alosa TaxID=278164 RepID=A0AAV6G7W5_9TELE|nr:hypothetical protein AALO_G00216050 [Alosa alosa]
MINTKSEIGTSLLRHPELFRRPEQIVHDRASQTLSSLKHCCLNEGIDKGSVFHKRGLGACWSWAHFQPLSKERLWIRSQLVF